MIENVHGIIIGPVTMTVTVHTPDGKQYGNSKAFVIGEEGDAYNWAEHLRLAVIEKLGLEVSRLGWNRPWEVRFYV